MANRTLEAKLLTRHDTAANWNNTNPVLSAGELGVEIDTHKLKIGDGNTEWISLPYIGGGTIANLPIATETTLGGIKVGSNLTISEDGTLSIPLATTEAAGVLSTTDKANLDAAYAHTLKTPGENPHGTTFGNLTGKPTTIAGYGITDAKIENDTITLGSNSVTPLTSTSSLDATKLTGTATINTTGNAATATSLENSQNITISGELEGSASFNGTAPITINIARKTATTLPETLALNTTYTLGELTANTTFALPSATTLATCRVRFAEGATAYTFAPTGSNFLPFNLTTVPNRYYDIIFDYDEVLNKWVPQIFSTEV